MLRFLDPKMQPIGLGYMGTIYCVLDSNTRIAVCRGGTGFYDEKTDTFQEGTVCNPRNWDDWDLIANMDEDKTAMMLRLIATTWAANEAAAYFFVTEQ